MKSVPLVALAALLAAQVAGVASAADLPSYGAPVAPISPTLPPVFTWTGAYIGFNVGLGIANRNLTSVADDGLGDTFTTNFSSTGGGVVGGVQVGYNYQFGGLGPLGGFRPMGYAPGVVVGLEGDFDGSGYGSSTTVSNDAGAYDHVRSGIDHIGSVRGRLGVAIDRALIYGTGGFAFGRTTTDANNDVGDAFHRSAERIGYAVGGGLEYMVTPNVGVRGEYLYYDLFRKTDAYTNNFGGQTVLKTKNDLNVVRLGMDYKFSGVGLGGLGNPFSSMPGVGALGF